MTRPEETIKNHIKNNIDLNKESKDVILLLIDGLVLALQHEKLQFKNDCIQALFDRMATNE